MNSFSRGFRNAYRNIIRTISVTIILAISIGLALTMLIARQAVTTKIDSVKSSIGNTINISPAGARGFEGGGEPLTNDEVAKVKNLPNVASVTAVLSDRLTNADTNLQSAIDAGSIGRRANQTSGDTPSEPSTRPRGNFTPPVLLTGTNSPSAAGTLGGGTLNVTSGQMFDPASDSNVAVIGQALATKNTLTIGSVFQAYGSDVQVVGLYDAGNQFANSGLLMPLATVQRLSNQPGAVSAITVQVDSISNLQSTQSSIKSILGDTADVTNQQDTSTQALAPLQSIQNITMVSLVGAVAASAIIILLSMLMIVRERRREIGVLKAIGASQVKVITQFMVEAITFTLMGTVVGLGIAILVSSPITQLLVTSTASTSQQVAPGSQRAGGAVARFIGQSSNSLRNIHTTIDWHILVYGLIVALGIAILGSIIPAWFISRVRPAEVMRTE